MDQHSNLFLFRHNQPPQILLQSFSGDASDPSFLITPKIQFSNPSCIDLSFLAGRH